ncbi:MAG: GDSL-type esterase/lipase family protein [Enterococcus sp.]|uniref:GDSL-type esterase/lipase family protein n=1 Tax=Enterococcus sp. TaxID=35783 RepID=UPI00399357CB
MAEYLKQQTTESIAINSEFPEKSLRSVWSSYDKNVHKIVVPVTTQSGIAFEMSEITIVEVYLSFSKGSYGPFEGKVEDAAQKTVSFAVPEEVRGQTGNVTISIMLKLTNDRQIDLVQFKAVARLSKIDQDTPAIQEFYVPLFENLVESVTTDLNADVALAKSKIDQAVTETQDIAQVEQGKIQEELPKIQTELSTINADIEAQKEKFEAASIYSKAEIDSKEQEITAQLAQTELKKLNRNENESITKAMLSQEIKEDLNNGVIEFKLNTSEIEDEAVSPQKIASEGFSVNVFNKESAVLGSYYSGNIGNQVTLINSSSWYGNHTPIAVKSGDVVRFNLAYMNGYYRGVDSNGKVLQTTPTMPNPAGSAEVTVAAGVVGFYTAAHKDNINDFMITINKPMPTKYTPHRFYKTLDWLKYKPKSVTIDAFSDEVIEKFSASNAEWVGKSFISNGTSISWQDGKIYAGTSNIARGYQTIIKEKLGFSSYVNAGASGKAMADGTTNGSGIVTTGLAQNYTTHALAIIEAATNDFKLNVHLGDIGNIGDTVFDRTTFFGAYRTLIEFILTQNPGIRLVLFTPLQRDNGGYNGWDFANTAGHTLNDYREAIFLLGKMYGLPVCDLYANSGFNKFSLSTFTMDGLHPNDSGYERMGNYAAQFINDIGV